MYSSIDIDVQFYRHTYRHSRIFIISCRPTFSTAAVAAEAETEAAATSREYESETA